MHVSVSPCSGGNGGGDLELYYFSFPCFIRKLNARKGCFSNSLKKKHSIFPFPIFFCYNKKIIYAHANIIKKLKNIQEL